MPWSINHNKEADILEVVYTGAITVEETTEATHEVLRLANKDGQLILVNLIGAKVLHSILDIYKEPELWEALGVNRKNKMVVLGREDSGIKDSLHFLETVSLNRGWNVKVLTDRSDAIEWLTG